EGKVVLEQYGFQNFRAFSSGRIELRPITVLLGANGCGKTSIIQPLLLFRQTVEDIEQKITVPLKLNGRFVNFGSAKNIFHNWNTSQPVTFEFVFDSANLHAEISRRIQREFRSRLEFWLNMNARELTVRGREPSAARRELPASVVEYTRASAIQRSQLADLSE